MNLSKIAFTTALCLGLSAMPVAAKDYVIALSPHVDAAVAKDYYTQKTIGFLVGLEPGDTATIMDGDSLATLGTFTIPENPAYGSPKARFAYNKALAAKISKFAKAAKVPKNAVVGTLRLPQLLRKIASNSNGAELDVIVLGSAIYQDRTYEGFTMTDSRFPNDAHLKHSRSVTPFGIDTPGLLKGLRVHQAYGDESQFSSGQHQYYIERFWSLYIGQQGGQLVSFTSDLPSLFKRVKDGAAPLPNDYKLDGSNKLEIIRLPPQRVTQTSIYNRPVTKTALTRQQVQMAQNLEVGISWSCDCDLDLYGVAHPGAAVLWFGNTKSEQGIYFKDYQTAPSVKNNGLETIAYTVPIDLRALKLYVAFYRGEAPKGVSGEVRISVDGKTYSKAFHITAPEGNSGENPLNAIQSGKIESNTLIEIDPLDVIAL